MRHCLWLRQVIRDICNFAAFLVSDSAAAFTGNIEYMNVGYHVVG